jgi:hypothetical protein
MKKLFTILVLLFLVSPCHAFMQMVGSGVASATGDASIIFYWGAESTAAEKSGGDTTVTLTSGANIDTTIKEIGTGSLGIPTEYDYASFDWTAGVLDLDKGRIGFYFTLTTFVANADIFKIYANSSNYLRAEIYATNRLRVLYASNGANTNICLPANDVLADGNTYFIEYAWDRANDTATLYINGSAVANNTNDMGTGWTANPATVVFGNNTTADTVYNLDQILISDDNTKDLYALRNTTSF